MSNPLKRTLHSIELLRFFPLIWILICSSCGYRWANHEESTLSLPYIQGDRYGIFTSMLIRQINESSKLRYNNFDGDYLLKVCIVEISHDQIGYRRDFLEENGILQDNIRPTEERKNMKVEIQVLKTDTQEVVLGPAIIAAYADYDYLDQDALQDLAFFDPATGPTTVLQFSLGQLETIESAQEASLIPLFQLLSQKIVNALNVHL